MAPSVPLIVVGAVKDRLTMVMISLIGGDFVQGFVWSFDMAMKAVPRHDLGVYAIGGIIR